MTPGHLLALVAAWFVLGMARIGFTSKLAEYRIDHPGLARALAPSGEAASARRDPANYDLRGRRLLPWYRPIDRACWIVAIGGCGWVVNRG